MSTATPAATDYTELYDVNDVAIGYLVPGDEYVTRYDLEWNLIGYRKTTYDYSEHGWFTTNIVTVTDYDIDFEWVGAVTTTGSYFTSTFTTEIQSPRFDNDQQLIGYTGVRTKNTDTTVETITYDTEWKITQREVDDGVVQTLYNANYEMIDQIANLDLMQPIQNDDGQITGYSYTSSDNYTHYYDTDGHATGHIYSDGTTTTTEYDGQWRLINHVYKDSDGYSSSEHHTYDAQGKLLVSSNKYTDADGSISNTDAYYDNGVLIKKVVFDGVLTSTMLYDNDGIITSETADIADVYAAGAHATVIAQTDSGYRYAVGDYTHYYDVDGQATGHIYSSTYDGTGYRSTSVTEYDERWNVVNSSYENSWGYSTNETHTYNEQGNLLTTVYSDSVGNSHNETRTYDTQSNLLTTLYSDSGGNSRNETRTYDAQGKLFTCFDHSTNADGSVSNTDYYYNDVGAVIKHVTFDGFVTTTYDGAGNVVDAIVDLTAMTPIRDAVTDDIIGYSYMNNGETHLYDTAGQLTGHRFVSTYDDGMGYISIYTTEYNADGQLTHSSDHYTYADGSIFNTDYYYEDSWVLVKRVTFDGVTTITYDSNGVIMSETADIAAMTPIHDTNDAIIGYSYASNGQTHLYDTAGHSTGHRSVSTYDDDTGYSVIYTSEYNAQWVLTHSSDAYTYSDGTTLNVDYYYDDAGELTQRVEFDGVVTTIYDGAGNFISENADMEKMTPVFNMDTFELIGAGYSTNGNSHFYDTSGHAVWHRYSGGSEDGDGARFTSTAEYDGQHRLVTTSDYHTYTNGRVSNTDHYYDDAGALTKRVNFDGVVTTIYDGDDHFVSEDADINKMTPVLDEQGVIVGYTYKTDNYTHFYDTAGQATNHQYTYGYDNSDDGHHYLATDEYDGQWHLVREYYESIDADGTGVESTSTYDVTEQLLTSATTMYALDAAGQLITVKTDTDATAREMQVNGFVFDSTVINLVPLVREAPLFGLNFYDGTTHLLDVQYDAEQQHTTFTIDVDGVTGGEDNVAVTLVGIDATAIAAHNFITDWYTLVYA